MSVSIGRGIKTIYSRAFASCPNLADVYCYAYNVPSMKDWNDNSCTDAFQGSNIEYATLHVLKDYISSYNSKAPWNNFAAIINIKSTESVTIGASGIATFCSSRSLDFREVDGLKAYIVTNFNHATGTLTLLEVKDAPAGTGLIVMGNAGSYDVPVSSKSTDLDENLLRGVCEIREHMAERTTEYYFTLSGQRTTGKPHKPGIYVKNGRKKIVR